MSSPSSGSHSGKRKRPIAAVPEMEDTLAQTSESRDASGEEGDTTAPESAAPSAHPSKRQRANSDRTAIPGVAEHPQDPGEPSDTTEASVDIAERVGRKVRGKNGGSKETEQSIGRGRRDSMPPPPIGKLTHPVGYTTNPPPTGRAVRVYADGVFDLFHLGYVHRSSWSVVC
jgi:choline-phosphate cytidylyltransferase